MKIFARILEIFGAESHINIYFCRTVHVVFGVQFNLLIRVNNLHNQLYHVAHALVLFRAHIDIF